jgi:hypothetical protein
MDSDVLWGACNSTCNSKLFSNVSEDPFFVSIDINVRVRDERYLSFFYIFFRKLQKFVRNKYAR